MTDEQLPSRRAAREAGAGQAPPPARAPRRPRKPAKPVVAGPVLVDEDGKPIAPKGGILAKIRQHPTAWMIGGLAALFVLLGTGAVFAGVAYGSTPGAGPAPQETQLPPRPQPTVAPTNAVLRTCSIAKLASDKRLMKLYASVRLEDSGEILYAKRSTAAARTGSVLKVLTASAAIEKLGADYQIQTKVVAGSTPGSIVLVGHGDPTLSAMPPGTESVYAGAPKLSSLAAATVAKFSSKYPGEQISKVVLDATYWNPSDAWDSTWERSEQTIGYHSEVTALQVDGDRQDPTQQTSPRSTDPIGRAGDLFVQALHDADVGGVVAPDVSITMGAAASTTTLASVKSQPLRVLIKEMLLNSDNTLAEMIARIVSKETGLGGSADSLQEAYQSALWPSDPDTATRIKIRDGSGLSDKNGVPAEVMSDLMRRVASGDENLDIVRDALPVAGKSGTLASRFVGNNAIARGHITAKTGWIKSAYTLAGFMKAKDGTNLTFALYAVGDGIPDTAKEALDTLATGIYKCGDNLAAF